MNKISVIFFSLFLVSCSSNNSGSKDAIDSVEGEINRGLLTLQDDIDISDLRGFWQSSCNNYHRSFLESNGSKFAIGENEVAIGSGSFLDQNCKVLFSEFNNLPDSLSVMNYTATPIGIFLTNEGVEAKVIELISTDMKSRRIAYYVSEEALFFTYEYNGNYSFDIENEYRVSE